MTKSLSEQLNDLSVAHCFTTPYSFEDLTKVLKIVAGFNSMNSGNATEYCLDYVVSDEIRDKLQKEHLIVQTRNIMYGNYSTRYTKISW